MIHTGFTAHIAERIIKNGKMTFCEINAAALVFHDEAHLMRVAARESRACESSIALLCRTGDALTERQQSSLVVSGAKNKAADLISKVRRKKLSAKYPCLVCDDVLREVRSEVRE